MMQRIRLAQPPGVRSCRGGGLWEHSSPKGGKRPHFTTDLRQIQAALEMTEEAWSMLLAELSILLNKAEKGELNFDSFNRKGIVCQCAISPEVLEIRLSNTVNFDGDRYLLRFYFSEPEQCEGIMISLSTAYKFDGAEGLTKQNSDIQQAAARLEDWLT